MAKKVLFLILIFVAFLRLYKITVNPPSLFGDELDLGYQAYSILKTGKDYQGNFMPLHFHSLAEWRTPLYLYSAVPTVAIFGITPLGVRLPAAIFGTLGIYAFYLLVHKLSKNQRLAILAALLLAINPWHLQYSRAGFEVTEMLFFLILGVYLFLKSLKSSKYLWLSVLFLTLPPWIYSTAKFFSPIFMLGLFILYKKEIFSIQKRQLILSSIVGMVLILPLLYVNFFGGGATRFNYISVFSDPVIESEVGTFRQVDAKARGETGLGLSPTLIDRIIHNKYTFVGEKVIKNYLQAFSSEFLFIKGDPDPRHSIGIGEFYRIEIFALFFGIVFFIKSKLLDFKEKLLISLWLIIAPLASSITRDGGNHATRLILLLPPIILVIALGWHGIFMSFPRVWNKVLVLGVVGIYIVSFGLYSHVYYVHYPLASERWWHYGWGPAFDEIKSVDSNYDKVIISMSEEPAWIFFAGYYQYPPDLWQKEYPIGNDVEVSGFGKISHTGKFFFGSPLGDVQIYGLGRYIDSKTLYLANAEEVGENLIINPQKAPADLKLLKSFPFPSGEPAFYLFEGTK